MTFAELLRSATETPLTGWDFGIFGGRLTEETTSWDYEELAADLLADAGSAVDLGTGGGELLSGFATLPARTVATECHPPNVPVAHRRLAPLGVPVVQAAEEPDVPLPFRTGAFDLVLNRHESYTAGEIRRVLAPGGLFLTQQVGGRDLAELNDALAAPAHDYLGWDLASAVAQLAHAGLAIVDQREEFAAGELRDIGAVALFLRIAPWQIPDYTVDAYRDRLRELHERMLVDGPLRVRHHRFVVSARTPLTRS